MEQFHNSLKLVIAFLILSLITSWINPIFGQYTLQSSDVTVASSGYITVCNISDFDTSVYQNGNLEIPGQIDGTTITGIYGHPTRGGAFQDKGINKLTLSDSISFIGIKAFSENSIDTLILGGGVVQINQYAFANNELTNVTLPSTLQSLYRYSFYGNTNLTSITLPINPEPGFAGWDDSDGNTYSGGDAITDFTLTYTAQFVESYTLIDADVTITNGVITACSNSITGTTIVIPDTLQGQEVIGIDANVFSSLNIEDVILPTPETYGFINWLSGTGSSYTGGETVTDLTTSYTAQFVTTYTLTDADVTISNGIISACSNVNNGAVIIIPDTLQSQEVIKIDSNVFSIYSSVTEIVLPASENPNFISWLSGDTISYEAGATVTDLITSYTAQFIYTLTDADVTISDGTISACSNINNGAVIIIPDTLQSQEVTGINANVFAAYSSITEIILPTPENSYFVSWISGTGTTYAGGSSITDFTTSYTALLNDDWYTLTDADAQVDKDGYLYAVYYDFSLKNIIIPDTVDGYAVKEIADNLFYDVGLIKLKMPSTLEIIGDYAFYDNQIESIEISDSTYIEMGVACFNKNKLSEINGNPSNGLIYARNSDGTNDSTTIVSYGGAETVVDFIPSNVTTIGYLSFIECDLSELVIPNTITEIGAAAFNLNTISKLNGVATNGIIFARKPDGSDDSTKIVSYCGSATNINFIPSTVTQIGKEAFAYSELTSVTIPTNIDTIEYGGFYVNNITSLTFTEGGNLKYLGVNAFYYNTGLTLTLPTSNYTNFSGWIDNYHTLYSAGSSVITNAAYSAYIPYTLTDADVVMQENNIVSYTNTDGYTAITIPDTLDGQAVIGVRADVFSNACVVVAYLPTHLNLPDFNGWLNFDNDTIKTSGYKIFDFDITYIANMPTYTLTSMDVVMSNNSLQSCSFSFGITDIIIPDTLDGQAVNGLGGRCFYNKDITSIQLPSTLESIGTLALAANKFSSITIPANVTTIGGQAFAGYYYTYYSPLTKVDFESGSKLTEIGDYAFTKCKYLTTVNLPDGIETISSYAFNDCGLTSIYFPNSIKTIGEESFCDQGTGSSSLISVTFEGNSNLELIGAGAFANNSNIASSGFKLPTSAYSTFRYFRCSGVGVLVGDQTNYSEEETTYVLTAQYVTEFTYTLTDADVTVVDNYITSYSNSNVLIEYITIPDTMDGQVIKGIAEKGQLAVFYNSDLRGVELPKYLEYISTSAFSGNPLSSINLPDSVVYIGPSAFSSTGIDSLILPNHTKTGFAGWLRSDGEWVELENGEYVTKDFYSISYSAAYEVLFYSYDEKLIKTDMVKHYQSATPPDAPERTGYTFTGWDTDYSYITKGLSVTAQYSVSTYTVIFNDWDGTQLSKQTIDYEKAATAPSSPTRSGYTFTGWDVSYSKVTSDLTITAQYSQDGATNYTVLFEDWNGTILSKQTVVEGNSASPPANPQRTGYSFTGWDNTYSSITSNVVINAQYSINSYPVTFKDYNETVLKTESVEYLKSATAPTEPTRTGYTFVGWDNDFSSIEDSLTVTATYTINAYTVTFKDWDGTTLKTESVDSLSSATAPTDPARLGYYFTGWDTSFETITEDLTVNAQYVKGADASTAIGDYVEGGVVFYIYQSSDDGYVSGEVNGFVCAIDDLSSWKTGWQPDYANNSNSLTALIGTSSDLGSGKSNTDTIVTYLGTPKTSEYVYNYSAYVCNTATINAYSDWFLPSKAELNKMYAQKSTINTVAVANGGSEFQEQNTSGTTQYYYSSSETSYAYAYALSFYNGTSENQVKTITNLIRPVREFSYSVSNTYTVIFKDWDKTVLRTQTVGEGDNATAPAPGGRTGYTFTGWDVSFNNITSDLTVTAQYSINIYTVTFEDYDAGIFKTEQVNYGDSATAPSDPIRTGYTFTGWNSDFSSIEDDLTVTATYSINTYSVKFKDYDGTVLDSQIIEYGQSATAPTASVRTGYTFIGWDADFSNITTDLTLTAQYSQNGVTNYTVIFKDWDKTVISTQIIAEDSAATAPTEPSRTGYAFTGWDTDFSKVTSNLTVTAIYSINKYLVSFNDYDGTLIKSDSVEYGKAATAPSDPVRTGYTFIGWDTDFSKITCNLTVTAQFNIKNYSITLTITDGTNPIIGSTITFSGSAYTTDANGQAIINNVENGTYPYTVEATGYETASGSVTVNGSDVSEVVTLNASTDIEISLSQDIKIYPNPTSGVININFENQTNKLELSIYNITGELVYYTPSFSSETLDLSCLNQGVYFVNVKYESNYSMIKLIKE